MQQQMNIEEKVDARKLRYVDSNEPSELRSELLKTGWIQQKLKHGDFMFFTCHYHKVGITRKTTYDFMNSINDIFAKQLEAMLEVFDICIMLVELPWVWISDNSRMVGANEIKKLTKEAVLNYIHRYQAKGFILERTTDITDTVIRLNELYALYQKPYSLSARSKGYQDERLLALPCGLRGKAGENLLAGRSLQQIANMDTKQILSLGIDGIGMKRASLIPEHFKKVVNIVGKSI